MQKSRDKLKLKPVGSAIPLKPKINKYLQKSRKVKKRLMNL